MSEITPQLIDQRMSSLKMLIGLRQNLIRRANDENADSDEPPAQTPKLFRSLEEYYQHKAEQHAK
jgi:hypothetical protein